ncbi:MAG: PepSY domain-containing protein [Steroidobacteraceae bacterium]|nr:PepSY domain-containing protein [Steroidobacteraceae bacterium]
MKRMNKGSVASALVGLGILVLAGSTTAQNAKSDEGITAEQATDCIKTAVANAPGRVESLEVDRERGQLMCEVEIVGDDGSESEIHIDVATNKVVRRAR